MKLKFLLSLFAVFFELSIFGQTVPISGYPRITTLESGDLFVIARTNETPKTNYSITLQALGPNLVNLNASNISGVVPKAASLVDGSLLTNFIAYSTNAAISFRNGYNVHLLDITVAGIFAPIAKMGQLSATNGVGTTTASINGATGVFTGDGSGLANLNASALLSGTIPYLRAGSFSNHNDVHIVSLTSGDILAWDGLSASWTNGPGGGGGGGGVPSARTISTTAPLSGGGDLSANRTFSITDAAADGSTKGASTFAAADFNSSSGLISLDYANGQKASASIPGFLSSADWSTFNGKQASGNYVTALTGDVTGTGPGSTVTTLAITTSAILDRIASTRGSILYRGVGGWAVLTPGTSGTYLKSQGSGADPVYDTPSGSGDALTANPLSQFAATTSAQLAGVLTDETGSGAFVLSSGAVLTNLTIKASNGTELLKISSSSVVAFSQGLLSSTVILTNGGVGGNKVDMEGTGSVGIGDLSSADPGSLIVTNWEVIGARTKNHTNSWTVSTPGLTNAVGVNTNGSFLVNGNQTNAFNIQAATINVTTSISGNGSGLISIPESAITSLTSDLSAKVPTSRSIATTSPLSGGGDLSADRTLSIANAAADGSTKGAASFAAADFNSSSGNITLDYANGQAATASVPGFLSAADWGTFNGKQASGNYITALTSDVTASGPGSAAATIANNAVTYAKMQDVSATQRVLGRNTAGAGDPEEVTTTQLLDWLGSTRGSVLYRGSSGWTILTPGTSGFFLKSQGSGADPVWASASGGSQTPWTAWEDAAQFGLTNLISLQSSNAVFGTNGFGPLYDALAVYQTNGVLVFEVSKTNGAVSVNGTGGGTISLFDSTHAFTTAFDAPATANRTIHLPDLSGTIALTANNLGAFAATTSAQLLGVISDETGSGSAVFATSPTLVTPTLGVASVTSVNKWVFTAPTTAATLTAGADNLTYTGPSSSQTLVGRTSTDTLQNKTLSGSNKWKGYIQLTGFMNITGAKPNNTNDYTASDFMKPVFLNGTAATANFVQFQIQVPTDFDTSVDPKIKIIDKLTAADTGVRRYICNTLSPAASAAYNGTVGTPINVDIGADASGASGDVEQSSQVTLTGWGSALTPGRLWIIQIGRDGNSGTDTSTVDSMFSSAEIEYGVTQ